ncbi:MAG: Mrp/NBP35 family ATP-binding protein [Pseudoflavonifractor sp.]
MSENCTHDCSSCGESCSDRKPESLLEPLNPLSSVGKVIAVVSGKGGVGKSMVTCSLATAMAQRGKRVGILDADITGPSVPTAFNLHERATGTDAGINPALTPGGIEVMSLNLLVEHETDPAVWRGPIIAGTVKQFWSDVVWGDLDYMFIDMPPGTGDVPLTVFQSIPVDGIIVVTSPQDLVSMIVTKAVRMAELMDIPVLGLVENYSYFKCPDCGKEHQIFGESRLNEVAEELGLRILARLPVDPSLATACDKGELETFAPNYLADLAATLEP